MEIRRLQGVGDGSNPVTLSYTSTFTPAQPGVLFGMALGEVDSSGNSHPDGFIAYLVPEGGNGLNIHTDYSIQGTSTWRGNTPLPSHWRIVIQFLHPPAGAVCTADLGIAAAAELPIHPTGDHGGTIATYPLGGLRLVKLDGTAGVTTLAMQPQSGFTWNVILAWGFHDDTSSRSLSWTFTDSLNTFGMGSPAAIAAQVVCPLTMNNINTAANYFTDMARFHNGLYPILNADALTAGKKLYIRAYVAEYGGLQ